MFDGDLAEGDQVTIESTGDSEWVVVNSAGIELGGESEAPAE